MIFNKFSRMIEMQHFFAASNKFSCIDKRLRGVEESGVNSINCRTYHRDNKFEYKVDWSGDV